MVDEKLGHGYQSVAELEDEAAVPRSCYIAPESIGILFKNSGRDVHVHALPAAASVQ
jgi:hypothetical protein